MSECTQCKTSCGVSHYDVLLHKSCRVSHYDVLLHNSRRVSHYDVILHISRGVSHYDVILHNSRGVSHYDVLLSLRTNPWGTRWLSSGQRHHKAVSLLWPLLKLTEMPDSKNRDSFPKQTVYSTRLAQLFS